MQRTTSSPTFARPGDVAAGAQDRAAPADPSYVQSILFGRRWSRGSRPGPTSEINARTAAEQERN
jgi:hypothetical protein